MSYALRYAVRSDRGLIRGNNEDSVYAGPRLLALADGMGGHAGGEVASSVAIGSVAYLDEDDQRSDLLDALREATEVANDRVRAAVEDDPELDGMGTTLTVLLFAGKRVGMLHIGDSRCYLLRGAEFSQITRDDTFVQALVDEGRLTSEEASTHPQRSLLLHALNGGELEPDLSVREAKPGDRYLLCSDGLSDVVSFETIHEALTIETPYDAADRLIELALRSGGPDNITVIVADVLDEEFGDDVVIVDGAAGEGTGDREVAPTSAAARAAIAAPVAKKAGQKKTDSAERAVATPPKRRRGLKLTIALVVLLVLAGGLYGGYRWTQTQYFVGEADQKVAVYRGVNASLGPWHLYTVAQTTDLPVTDLQQVARDKVSERSLTAGSQNGAEDIVTRLKTEQLLPQCPVATPTPKPTTPKPTTPKATTPSGATSGGATSGGASTGAVTSGAPTSGVATTTPAKTTTPPKTSATAVPTNTLVPGRDCRVVG